VQIDSPGMPLEVRFRFSPLKCITARALVRQVLCSDLYH
jgi:hypothetical protein